MDLHESPGAIERVIEEVFKNPFPPSPQGIYHQSRAITSCDTSTRLSGIECPTLAVDGTEDILGGLPLSEELVHGIRGAELVILDKSGHGLPTESPEATAAAMLDFLSRNLLSSQ
jgi:pimeloyl-ACP methyl ester carboxylesterase